MALKMDPELLYPTSARILSGDKKFLHLELLYLASCKQEKYYHKRLPRRCVPGEMEDEHGGLFNIEVSSAEESANDCEKVPRDFQSEEDFQRQRAAWRPKIETGEVLAY